MLSFWNDTVVLEYGVPQHHVDPEKRRLLEEANGEDVDLSTIELLEIAKKNLKCVEGNLIELSDFQRSGRDIKDTQGQTHISKSRYLREDERIDYFISHAWCDQPENKFRHLASITSAFLRAKDRSPTMWFDKHCFDQENITESLKVLAIYLLSCDKIRILCGPGYALRLWCVWEIFTLFAVASDEVALRRIELVTFGDDTTHQHEVLERLCRFELSAAHCFDPNEEFKLKAVISAVGVAAFEARIRLLGTKIKTDLLQNKEEV